MSGRRAAQDQRIAVLPIPSSLRQVEPLLQQRHGGAADHPRHPGGPRRLGDQHRHTAGPQLRHRADLFEARPYHTPCLSHRVFLWSDWIAFRCILGALVHEECILQKHQWCSWIEALL